MSNKLTRESVLNSLAEEITNIKKLSEKETDTPIEEQEEFREALSIEKETVVKILLSWGGGEDGYKLTFKNKELIKGVYYMADWGEYEEVELHEEELSLIYNVYLFGEYPEQE